MADPKNLLLELLTPRLTDEEVLRLKRIVAEREAEAWRDPEAPQYKNYGKPWSAADLAAIPQGQPEMQARVARLEGQLLSMALYCRTLLQVMVDKQIITVEEFQQRMEQLDLADGVRDGR